MTRDLRFEDYDELVTLLYASAVADTGIAPFLKRLSEVGGGIRCHAYGHDLDAGYFTETVAVGYSEEALASYGAHYAQLNAWAPGIDRSPLGRATAAEVYLPREDLLRTGFYQDWIRREEDCGTGGGIVIHRDRSRMYLIGGNIRLREQERLQTRWLGLLDLLSPHIRTSFDISCWLAEARLRLLAPDGADPGTAMLLVDESGYVSFANAAAERHLAEGRLVRRGFRGRLAFADPRAEDCLAAIRRDLWRRDREGTATLRLGGGTVRCHLARLDPEALGAGQLGTLFVLGRPCVMLTLTAERGPAPLEILRRRFGLTLSEAEVVMEIASGATVAEIAEQRSKSVQTVRNQVKSALAKTGNRRQADLVRLVAGIVTPQS